MIRIKLFLQWYQSFWILKRKNSSMRSWSFNLLAIEKKVSGHLRYFGRCRITMIWKKVFSLDELGTNFSPVIFVTVCFLIILLLPKQTIRKKKKLTKQRKYKNDQKTNPTSYILRNSLLITFLILLPNKTKQPKETNMSHKNTKNPSFKINFWEILDITWKTFFKMPTFLPCSSKYLLIHVWSIFQLCFISLRWFKRQPGSNCIQ